MEILYYNLIWLKRYEAFSFVFYVKLHIAFAILALNIL